MPVDHCLKLLIDLLTLREKLIQVRFSQRAAQGRLGDLGRGVEVVLHLEDRAVRVENAEIDHGVHLHGNVVLRDHVLGRHVHRHGSELDPHHLVHDGDEEDDAGSLRADGAAEPEHHTAFVLAQYLDGAGENQKDQEDYDRSGNRNHRPFPPMLSGRAAAGRRRDRPPRARPFRFARPLPPPSMPRARTPSPPGFRDPSPPRLVPREDPRAP